MIVRLDIKKAGYMRVPAWVVVGVDAAPNFAALWLVPLEPLAAESPGACAVNEAQPHSSFRWGYKTLGRPTNPPGRTRGRVIAERVALRHIQSILPWTRAADDLDVYMKLANFRRNPAALNGQLQGAPDLYGLQSSVNPSGTAELEMRTVARGGIVVSNSQRRHYVVLSALPASVRGIPLVRPFVKTGRGNPRVWLPQPETASAETLMRTDVEIEYPTANHALVGGIVGHPYLSVSAYLDLVPDESDGRRGVKRQVRRRTALQPRAKRERLDGSTPKEDVASSDSGSDESSDRAIHDHDPDFIMGQRAIGMVSVRCVRPFPRGLCDARRPPRASQVPSIRGVLRVRTAGDSVFPRRIC